MAVAPARGTSTLIVKELQIPLVHLIITEPIAPEDSQEDVTRRVMRQGSRMAAERNLVGLGAITHPVFQEGVTQTMFGSSEPPTHVETHLVGVKVESAELRHFLNGWVKATSTGKAGLQFFQFLRELDSEVTVDGEQRQALAWQVTEGSEHMGGRGEEYSAGSFFERVTRQFDSTGDD